MTKKLTDQQKIDLVKDYLETDITVTDLGKKYNITRSSATSLLKNRKIKIRQRKFRRYHFDENYFDFIDTEDKAYFLGLLYADGYNNVKNNRINITLQARDVDILLKFKTYIKHEKELHYRVRNIKNPNHQNVYKLDLCSQHLCKQLVKLGCLENKSLILKFPTSIQVPEYLMRHFLRGYWDGDGTVGIYKNKKTNYCQISTSIAGSHSFCLSSKHYLENKLNIHCSYFTTKGANYSRCSISGKQQTLLFLNYLYEDATVYLDRKYNKYLQVVDLVK